MTLDGLSLNKIRYLTGLEKTTIYYNVKDLKPRVWRKLMIDISEEKIGELMGAFSGDGSYYHAKNSGNHRVRITLCISRDMEYANYLIDLLKKLNLNPFLFKKKNQNAMDICVNSIEYINFIRKYLQWEGKRTYSIRLKENLNVYTDDFLRGFARGLMDTDGFVEVCNVACGCTSERLIKNLAEIFDKFEIKYRISIKKRKPLRKDLFLIRTNRKGLNNFSKTIGFSNPYKLEKLKLILKI